MAPPVLTLLCPGALATALLPGSTGLGAPGGWPSAWRDVEVLEQFELDAVGARELPHEAWLRRRFGLPDDTSVAAATAVVDTQAAPVWRLTPACLQTGRDQLMLLDPAELGLDADEVTALAASLRPWVEEDGWDLITATLERWYLRRRDGSQPPRFTTHGSGAAQGRAVDAYMPFELEARPWRRLLNEIQMLWHDHPVNIARIRAGRLPVNTLWLEGAWLGGAHAERRPFAQISTTDPALAGLAAFTGAALDRPPPGAPPDLPPTAATQTTLIQLDFWPTVPSLDAPRFQAAWQSLNDWLAATGLLSPPARQGLEVVLSGERRCVVLRVRRPAPWRFWRQARPDAWLERLERPDPPPAADGHGRAPT